jgi:hypothetical protein
LEIRFKYPKLFFGEIAKSDRLSTKNAMSFCLASATVIAAAIVSIYSVAVIIVKLTEPTLELQEVGLTTWAIIELSVFGVIILYTFGSVLVTYLSALRVIRIVPLKRIIIASLYMTTFLLTITCGLVIGVIITVLVASDEDSTLIEYVWTPIIYVWRNIIAPVMSTTAYVYVTGISAAKWLLGGIILIFGTFALLLGIAFCVTLLSPPFAH